MNRKLFPHCESIKEYFKKLIQTFDNGKSLKFGHSEKATKIRNNHPLDLTIAK